MGFDPFHRFPWPRSVSSSGGALVTLPVTVPVIWCAAVLLCCAVLWSCGGGQPVSPPTPHLHGVAAELLDTWRHADLVCLGETHGSIFDGALRQALVEQPRFPATVDVIVVELANPLHQDLLDRWLLDLEPLSRQELRPLWLDAGLGETWELPPYEAFLRAVATMNAGLPREDRVPVVGAALPIDWQTIRHGEDLAPFRDRIGHFETVLRRHILDGGRKGLAIFGRGHCERRAPSLLSRLAATHGDRVWATFGFEARGGVAAGRRILGLGKDPTLLTVRGTPTASLPTGDMFFEGHSLAGLRLGDLVDSIVDYGAANDIVLDPADLDLEPALAAELQRRAALWLTPPGD